MGFCECTSKFILFIFNLCCAILGLVIIGFSVVTNLHGKPFKDILDGQLTVVSIILIVVGVLVFLIAFFGCCGAIRESKCMLNTYAVVLSIILIVQFAMGITALVYKNKLENGLDSVIVKTFENFENGDTQDIVNEIQKDLQCCGVYSPDTWPPPLPSSCCGLSKDQTCDLSRAYPDGCEKKIVDMINSSLKILGGIAIGIAVVELICIIIAFCLTNSFSNKWRNQYG